MSILTSRWNVLRPHVKQSAFYRSSHRFNIVPAGRRSGKTELAKRKIVRAALRGTAFDNPRFFAAAPTRDQAKRIYWNDLKSLVPRHLRDGRPSEGDLMIPLVNGSEIYVIGMDKPERMEGQPWDGGVLDEYGNMKEKAWPENVRPALSDRLGWCDFIGVPEGMNHYHKLYERAKEQYAELGVASPWAVFEWASVDILGVEEVEAARKDLHPLVFKQEYGGEFVDFSGVAILDTDKWLVTDPLSRARVPIPFPESGIDSVFAVIDTAVKTGQENDGTAVIYLGRNRHVGWPLVILDWDIQQIEGGLLINWLPSVFETLQALAMRTKAREGSLGAWVEDRVSGSVLIQQARQKAWPARAIPETLTALGKDERALAVSGHVYTEKVKITAEAHRKVVMYKGEVKNHLISQVNGFRIGDPAAAKRADDCLDTFTYGCALALGHEDSY